MRHPHLIGATKSVHRCLVHRRVGTRNNPLALRCFSTSRPMFNEANGSTLDTVESASSVTLSVENASSTSSLPITMENMTSADLTEINQIALETGSNTGLAFISNNIMSTFNWLKSFISSGDSAYVWNDVVTHKLTHLYIPSIYELVQYHTGLTWFVVIGSGTLTLRFLLLPLTRRSMRFPTVVRSILPQMKMYEDLIDVYTKQKDQDRVEKLSKWKNDYMKSANVGAVVPSLLGTTFVMVALNRGMRHLAHTTPLMFGGFGPFLDMSVNSHSGVAFYCLPLCITTAIASIMHLNLRNEKWYNPRISVVAIPVGGVFTYFLSAMPLTMTLHYAISSWCTFLLNYCAQHETLRTMRILQLPKPFYKPPVPEKMKLSKKVVGHQDYLTLPSSTQTLESTGGQNEEKLYAEDEFFKIENDIPSRDRKPDGLDHINEVVDLRSERVMLEEFIDVKESSSSGERRPLQFSTPYTPFFKLGQHDVREEPGPSEVTQIDNIQTPPQTGGFVSQVGKMRTKFQYWKRIKHWYHRQKLMRHGKKGKMSMFLDEAPQETIFIKEAIQLTTKVTPGLKRYVLRRQYPINTLEELERKVSYMERVQGPRW